MGDGDRDAEAPPVAVALVASAGGFQALRAILASLPQAFPAAVVVAQHLGPGSDLAALLDEVTALPVSWVQDGAPVETGTVVVAPPSARLQVTPDQIWSVVDTISDARTMPFDHLLGSMAAAYGRRAVAVVLTGRGEDGAAGAQKLKEAGGVVIVQSRESADQPSMPAAALRTGAADAVLPVEEIGDAVIKAATGVPLH